MTTCGLTTPDKKFPMLKTLSKMALEDEFCRCSTAVLYFISISCCFAKVFLE